MFGTFNNLAIGTCSEFCKPLAYRHLKFLSWSLELENRPLTCLVPRWRMPAYLPFMPLPPSMPPGCGA